MPVGSSASKKRRLVDDGARNADELLLPAGKLAGKQIFLGDDLKPVQRVGDQALPLAARNVFIRERQVDVLLHGEIVEQVIALEHHADILLGQFSTLLALHRRGQPARETSTRPATDHRARQAH